MNANELADELTKMFRGEEYDRLIHEIPDVLRKQQAEIEALKEALSVKVILNEHAQQSMKEVKGLLRKAQEK